MKRSGGTGRGNIALLLVTVGFLILGLGGYYYLRTTVNSDRLRERNLRELARMSRAIEAKVNNFQKILESFPEENGEDRSATKKLIEELSGLKIELRGSGTEPPPPADLYRLEVSLADRELRLHGPTGDGLTGKLADLLPFLASDLFDTVFLAASQTEDVLLQTPGAGIRLQQLPRFAASPEGEAQKASDLTRAAATETARRPGKYSMVHEVRVAGRDYQLFLQPVRIHFQPHEKTTASADGTPQGGATAWLAGALVASERFRAESRAIDPSDLLFLGLLLILGILALPFLKIRTMGPHERVEVRDVFALGFAYVLASGFLGLCLGDLAHYVNLRDELDRRLEEVGLRVKGNLSQEIEDALAELEKQTKRFESDRTACFAAGIYDNEDDWRRTGYPHLQMIFWTDEEGRQRAKWTTRKQNTPPIKVDHREYFQRVRDDRLWTREVDGQIKHYFLESIRSVTTGEYQAALSMRGLAEICCPGEDCSDQPEDGQPEDGQPEDGQRGAAVLTTRLASLDRPVLPAGVELAVVEPDGRTLFHSRQERNLAENFFEETGSDRLRSLVYARRQDLLSSTYRGRASRLFVTPIDRTPLSLIVVHDRASLRTVRLEALLIGGGLFNGHGLLLLLGYGVLCFGFAPTPLIWAWPDRDRPRKYQAFIGVLLLFAGGMALPLAVRGSPHPGSFLLPFEALGLALVMLSSGVGPYRRRTQRHRRRHVQQWLGWGIFAACLALGAGAGQFGFVPAVQLAGAILAAVIVILYRRFCEPESRAAGCAYVPTILLILLVVGLLPGYLFYRSVFNARLDLLVRHHQLEAAQALRARRERLEKIRLEEELPAAYRERSLVEDIDVAFQPFFTSCYQIPEVEKWRHYPKNPQTAHPDHREADPREPDIHGIIQALVDQRFPLLTEPAVEMRHLHVAGSRREGGAGSDAAMAAGWSWWRTDSEPDELMFRTGLPRYRIVSRLPSGLATPTWQWWLAVVVAVPILWWLVRWQSRRVFLTDLEPADRLSLEKVVPPQGKPIEHSLLIICTRSCDRSALERHPEVGRVDLMRLAEEWSAGALEVSAVAGKAPVVCLDFFDHRLEEPEWNNQVLVLLEKLVYSEKRTVVLLSSRSPDDLLFAPPAADEEQADSQRRSERWARLLGRFVQVTIADSRWERPEMDPGESPLDAVLRQECDSREPLWEIRNWIQRRFDFSHLSRDALIDEVRETADGYYRAQWAILGKEEKLVVAQLAAGSVVNPKCRRSLRRLVARGLLVRDPELRLINESFGRFVREVVPASQVAAWEREGTASRWQQVRLPLVLILAAAAIFLFATQREAFQLAIAFVSAVAVGVPAIFKLLEGVRRASGDTAVF